MRSLPTLQTDLPEISQAANLLLLGKFLIYFGIILLSLILFISCLRIIFRKIGFYQQIFNKVVFLITLPKESLEEEKEKKEIKDYLSPAETFLDNLGGLPVDRSLKTFFFGRHDHFSLEIVRDKEGLISFYMVVPRYLANYTEQQIHAQFPSAQIEEVEDYNLFSPKSVILASFLTLKKSHILPIKTYLNLNVDPLNAITNSLTKIEEGDSAAIQIIARSAKKEWHRFPAKVAREMQQGKNLKQAMRAAGANPLVKFMADFTTYALPKEKKKEKEIEEKPKQLSPMDQEIVKSIENKNSKAGLDINIRIIVSAKTKEQAQRYLETITNSFHQYTIYEYGNGFQPHFVSRPETICQDFIYRNIDEKRSFILNTEELTSIFHFPLPTTETPNIRWLIARKAPAPVEVPKEGIILGKNIYRGKETLIRIKRDDRRRHVYIIGKTGTGKTVLISNMVKQDICNGEGVGVIDPHGDLIEDILGSVPRERVEDVILFDASDTERPIGLNMLEAKTEEQKDFAVQEMIAIFYKLFPPEIIGPMFEHNMRNVMLTLMADRENPGTIAEIPRMFSDPDYAKAWTAKLKDPIVRAFWEKEMARTTEFHKSEMLGYLISKVGRFVENEMMRNIIGQAHSGIDFREVMDKQKILLVNLSKGKIGEVNANLLGLVIVSKLQMAAMARADLPEAERKDFYLYIDEFQNFITDSIATILSEARKYRLNLTMAHQYLGQLLVSSSVVGGGGGEARIRDAVLGTVGTMITFKIGIEDAEILAKEYKPVFNEYDLINVEKFNAYVKLLVNNQPTRPFNMVTLPPKVGDRKIAEAIRQISRLKYGRPKAIVEKEILERSQLGVPARQDIGLEKNL
ncbi:MAG: type IV secretion system DNA-binding domain-containing protein [Patescibacteria group bacterium]|nr:type IV secretion system DNA-binding domain-containing protein [Patescibacteria group bacterium]